MIKLKSVLQQTADWCKNANNIISSQIVRKADIANASLKHEPPYFNRVQMLRSINSCAYDSGNLMHE